MESDGSADEEVSVIAAAAANSSSIRTPAAVFCSDCCRSSCRSSSV